MKKRIKTANIILAMVLALCMSLTACGEEVNEGEETQNDAALDQAISELTPSKSPTKEDPGKRVMTINRSDNPPYDNTGLGEISIAEPPVLDIETDDTDVIDDTPQLEEGTYTGNGTPLVFDISDCTCIAFGEFDKTMSDAILAAVNVYRANANLEPLQHNQSLMFCADCRSKEASYSFSHTRVNGTYWFTVAPAYYKAELMASDFATAQQTVDAWMQTATGRQYLLGNEYLSIGIFTFRSGGRNYIVCALGD